MSVKLPGFLLLFFLTLFSQYDAVCQNKITRIFNGKSFAGWEGDTVKTWRIKDGAIVGGSLVHEVPQNDFLCTVKPYANFILKLRFKLLGTEGFINSGVQFRSIRHTNPPNEMIGYQADLGDGYWASIYDESRRNKTLTPVDTLLINKILKRNQWNDYEIHCNGKNIKLYLNGTKTADYTEPDDSVFQSGVLGLQIHDGGKAEVHFKDIFIEEL